MLFFCVGSTSLKQLVYDWSSGNWADSRKFRLSSKAPGEHQPFSHSHDWGWIRTNGANHFCRWYVCHHLTQTYFLQGKVHPIAPILLKDARLATEFANEMLGKLVFVLLFLNYLPCLSSSQVKVSMSLASATLLSLKVYIIILYTWPFHTKHLHCAWVQCIWVVQCEHWQCSKIIWESYSTLHLFQCCHPHLACS